jgi:hypothetical protein
VNCGVFEWSEDKHISTRNHRTFLCSAINGEWLETAVNVNKVWQIIKKKMIGASMPTRCKGLHVDPRF